MTELLTKLVTDHGLAAVLGMASILVALRVGARVLDGLSDQNKSIGRLERSVSRLLERGGMESEPPPEPTPRRRSRGITGFKVRLATSPIGVPWTAPEYENDAAPEHVEPERSAPQRRRRPRGE